MTRNSSGITANQEQILQILPSKSVDFENMFLLSGILMLTQKVRGRRCHVHALVIHSLEQAGIKRVFVFPFVVPKTFNSVTEVELIGVLDFVFVLTKSILKNIVLIKGNLVNLLTCLLRRWRREKGRWITFKRAVFCLFYFVCCRKKTTLLMSQIKVKLRKLNKIHFWAEDKLPV